MCDSKEMYEILIQQHKTMNQISNDKIHFINQLVDHRNLKLEIPFDRADKKIYLRNIFLVRIKRLLLETLVVLFNNLMKQRKLIVNQLNVIKIKLNLETNKDF